MRHCSSTDHVGASVEEVIIITSSLGEAQQSRLMTDASSLSLSLCVFNGRARRNGRPGEKEMVPTTKLLTANNIFKCSLLRKRRETK